MQYIRYINYKNDDGTIETIEDFGLLIRGNYSRQYRRNILAGYRLNDTRYYGSNRASKSYYQSLKDKDTVK